MLDIFSSPKNPKSLLLPESKLPCNTKLPEDCHYQPEDLVKLFLLSNVKVVSFNYEVLSVLLMNVKAWSDAYFISLMVFYAFFISVSGGGQTGFQVKFAVVNL